MVSAVNSSATSFVASTSSTSSTPAIRAQLEHDKRELADCVTCESSKTREGKANIQKLSSKISTEEAQLKQADTSRPTNQSAQSNLTAVSSNATNQSSEAPVKKQNSFDTNIGNNLDVFA